MRKLEILVERWPIAGSFTISRGSRTEAVVVVARITEEGLTGMGECVPYARYGESIESVIAQMSYTHPVFDVAAVAAAIDTVAGTRQFEISGHVPAPLRKLCVRYGGGQARPPKEF